MNEARETKIKRLHMRSIRRGIKEMDLILSDYAIRHLPTLSDEDLSLYDTLLSENDHDIYGWVTGHIAVPDRYNAMMVHIKSGAHGLTSPN